MEKIFLGRAKHPLVTDLNIWNVFLECSLKCDINGNHEDSLL